MPNRQMNKVHLLGYIVNNYLLVYKHFELNEFRLTNKVEIIFNLKNHLHNCNC